MKEKELTVGWRCPTLNIRQLHLGKLPCIPKYLQIKPCKIALCSLSPVFRAVKAVLQCYKTLAPAGSDRNQHTQRQVRSGHATSSQFFRLNRLPQLQEQFLPKYLFRATRKESHHDRSSLFCVMRPFLRARTP
ncbi:hypothetical protein Q9966_006357 [Columba livia]|nr:hypothetical protein Q9966_006357 [Columba livia]